MLLIEGLKEVKGTLRKMEDIRAKIAKNSADLDIQSPAYPDQKKQVSEWLQAHHDLALYLTTLKRNIQRTNLATEVGIRIGDNTVIRTIAEWIIRRRESVDLEVKAWGVLTDRNLNDTAMRTGAGDTTVAKVRRYYDSVERDKNIELLHTEKESIDKVLEVRNATTQLIE